MKILLDENFPLGLLRRLRAEGLTADHIITLDWRGASDTKIRAHLQDDHLLFLTQDEDFLYGPDVPATVIVSRVRQARPLKLRIDIWCTCVQSLLAASRPDRLFELMDDGRLLPWQGFSIRR